MSLSALMIFALLAHPVFAQDNPTSLDTTVVITNRSDTTYVIQSPGDDDYDDHDGFNINIGHDHDHDSNLRFSLLDFGVSTYLFDGGFDLPAQHEEFEQDFNVSLNINWHLFRHRLPLAKKKLGLEYGLTLSWNDYKFDNDFEILTDQETFMTIPVDKKLKKNKLKTTHLEVPLMLTLVPGKRQSYFISAGVYGGLLIGSKQKIKFEDGGTRKIKDDFNLNKVRYGIEARLGLGAVSFYGRYSLQPLFQDGTGPELYPLNFGITVLGF